MLFIPYAGDIDPSLELIHLHHGIHTVLFGKNTVLDKTGDDVGHAHAAQPGDLGNVLMRIAQVQLLFTVLLLG